MGLLGRLFSSESALEKGVDATIKGVDAIFYTDEEKVADKKEILKEVGKQVIEWMSASQGHRLARRLISIAITFVWLSMYALAALLNLVAVFVIDNKSLYQSANSMYDYAISMNGAVMLILGFYFAAPYLGEIVKPAMDKFRK